MGTAENDTGQSASGYHRIATFISCPQKFAYRYLLNLKRPTEGMATGIGTVLHEALYAYYVGVDVGEQVGKLPARYSACIRRGMELFEEYQRVYPVDPWSQVLLAEHEIEVALGDHRFTRRLDLVVLWGGKIWVLDHKTAGRVTSRLRSAELDWSLATQELVGESVLPGMFGAPWGGFVLNVIGTGTEAVDCRYKRQPLRFPARFMSSLPRSLHWYFERAAALEGTDPWCYPRSGKCMGQYGACDFVDLCRYGRSAERNFKKDE